jgi:hypothetical protein
VSFLFKGLSTSFKTRLVLVRELYETCVEAGYKESVSRILPVLSNFVSDSEPAVRQIFAEQLDQLAEFFLKVKTLPIHQIVF